MGLASRGSARGAANALGKGNLDGAPALEVDVRLALGTCLKVRPPVDLSRSVEEREAIEHRPRASPDKATTGAVHNTQATRRGDGLNSQSALTPGRRHEDRSPRVDSAALQPDATLLNGLIGRTERTADFASLSFVRSPFRDRRPPRTSELRGLRQVGYRSASGARPLLTARGHRLDGDLGERRRRSEGGTGA